MARNKHYVPYKKGQILISKPDNQDRSGKIKILKYNGDKHYKILLYYYNAHNMANKVLFHVHTNELDRYKFELTLSNTLKRL